MLSKLHKTRFWNIPSQILSKLVQLAANCHQIVGEASKTMTKTIQVSDYTSIGHVDAAIVFSRCLFNYNWFDWWEQDLRIEFSPSGSQGALSNHRTPGIADPRSDWLIQLTKVPSLVGLLAQGRYTAPGGNNNKLAEAGLNANSAAIYDNGSNECQWKLYFVKRTDFGEELYDNINRKMYQSSSVSTFKLSKNSYRYTWISNKFSLMFTARYHSHFLGKVRRQRQTCWNWLHQHGSDVVKSSLWACRGTSTCTPASQCLPPSLRKLGCDCRQPSALKGWIVRVGGSPPGCLGISQTSPRVSRPSRNASRAPEGGTRAAVWSCS